MKLQAAAISSSSVKFKSSVSGDEFLRQSTNCGMKKIYKKDR